MTDTVFIDCIVTQVETEYITPYHHRTTATFHTDGGKFDLVWPPRKPTPRVDQHYLLRLDLIDEGRDRSAATPQ